MKNYGHIFFDLDSTLWDFETNSHETLTQLIDKYKLCEKGVDSIEGFIARYLVINERMWEEYGKGLIDKKALRYERFHETLLQYEINDRSLTENFGDDYITISPYKTNMFPHCIEVLGYLKEKYVLHIITNGFEEVQFVKIKNCRIDHYFDQIITSERSGFKKPDIRIFKFSLNAATADASKSLMIGDSLDADIIGARNAGIDQVYFNPNGAPHEEKITCEIKSLKELISLL